MNAVVIIAERRMLSGKTTMFSNELDFSSITVTDRILEAFDHLGIPTFYYESPKAFLDHIGQHQNDVVFSALWGGYHSRNKRSLIAAICEAYHICYIGADAFVQALCQDKYLTKSYLHDFGFLYPKGILISSLDEIKKLEIFSDYPCIVKPNDEGCSVGISKDSLASTSQKAEELVRQLLPRYSPVLVEQFIPGEEISVCCAGQDTEPDVLEAVQLIVNGNKELDRPWGFEAKKVGHAVVTREVVTNSFPQDVLHKCWELFLSLGKVDLMRIDGKLYNGNFYIIELSPDCSLHETCFMATAFAHRHFSYNEMLLHLVQEAWKHWTEKK